MTGATRPDIPAAKVCEHFYASHCYRGMSVRLCMLCHEPDWDDLAGQLAASPATATAPAEPSTTAPVDWRAIADELAEAIRLTREYVEPKVALPPIPGWGWHDAMCRYREAVVAASVSPAPGPSVPPASATGSSAPVSTAAVQAAERARIVALSRQLQATFPIDIGDGGTDYEAFAAVLERGDEPDCEARAEAAEAKLAKVRSVLLEGGQGDATARCRAIAIVGTGEEPS